jgi:hypothetical protein
LQRKIVESLAFRSAIPSLGVHLPLLLITSGKHISVHKGAQRPGELRKKVGLHRGWPLGACLFLCFPISDGEKSMVRIFMITAASAAVLTLSGTAFAQAQAIEYGKDRPGNDYRNMKVKSPEQCQGACRGEARCRAWTWNRNSGLCYLKAPAPQAVDSANGVSGRK